MIKISPNYVSNMRFSFFRCAYLSYVF